jgi:hypothetical protein
VLQEQLELVLQVQQVPQDHKDLRGQLVQLEVVAVAVELAPQEQLVQLVQLDLRGQPETQAPQDQLAQMVLMLPCQPQQAQLELMPVLLIIRYIPPVDKILDKQFQAVRLHLAVLVFLMAV